MTRRRLLAWSVLWPILFLGCGGAFLPPPAPGRVCIYDLQGHMVPKDDCGCFYLVGSFTRKHYKLRPCPKVAQ